MTLIDYYEFHICIHVLSNISIITYIRPLFSPCSEVTFSIFLSFTSDSELLATNMRRSYLPATGGLIYDDHWHIMDWHLWCVFFFVARIVWTNVRFGYGLRKSLLKKVAKVPQVDSERCVYHVLICPAKRRVLIAIWSQSAHLVPMLQGVLSWELFVRSTQWIHQVVIYRNFFSPKDK